MRKTIRLAFVFALTAITCVSWQPALGQNKLIRDYLKSQQETAAAAELIGSTIAPESTESKPELDRSSPHAALDGFFRAIRSNDFASAINYLDLRDLKPEVARLSAVETARRMKVVMDRSVWIDMDMVSADNKATTTMSSGMQRLLIDQIPLYDQQVGLYMQGLPDENGELIWKISNATLNQLPELYEFYSDGVLAERLSFLPEFSMMGMKLWQWIVLFVLLVAGYLVAYLPTMLIAKWLARRDPPAPKPLITIFTGPLRILIMLLFVRQTCDNLRLGHDVQRIVDSHTLIILAVTWALLASISLIRDYMVKQFTERKNKPAAKLLGPLSTILKTIILVTALLIWLENLGFKATTILAGLGIGGLAIALAAQKSIENLIAAVTLYVSAPVKVGNLCKFGKSIGIIEDIGLRYTQVRTLDRTLINIPNAKFVDMELINYSKRDRMRYKPNLLFRYNTPADKVKAVMEEIIELLSNHEQMRAKPLRVKFAQFGDYGLELNILSYVDTTRFPIYIQVADELNLAILDIVAKHGVELADTNQRHISSSGNLDLQAG